MKKCYNRQIMKQKSQVVDDFWTHDIPLFDGSFRFYRKQPRPVRAKVHVSDERYFDKYDEIVSISPRAGIRTYVMFHPYVFEPILTFTVGLYKKPKQYADQDSAIGETIGEPRQEGVREVKIGSGQAWYYPADKIVVLWECFLERFVRDQPFPTDPHQRQLWRGFEDFLRKQFPDATQLVTPFNDPITESIEEYQEFLRSLGYESVAKAAFGKKLK